MSQSILCSAVGLLFKGKGGCLNTVIDASSGDQTKKKILLPELLSAFL